jgi:hypothetical protein
MHIQKQLKILWKGGRVRVHGDGTKNRIDMRDNIKSGINSGNAC